jgi:hypothetical protein
MAIAQKYQGVSGVLLKGLFPMTSVKVRIFSSNDSDEPK